MRTMMMALLIAGVLLVGGYAQAGDEPAPGGPENPCAGKAENPCGGKAENPCAGKAENPCGGKAENPCGDKAGNPCNPCGEKAASDDGARVPDAGFAKRGRVFDVNDPKNRNSLSFSSSAPLEDIVGTTNDVKGYLVFDPDRPEMGLRGEFTVAVASLETGIPLRDEHMRGEAWLDAAAHPDITFRIVDTGTVDLRKQGDGFRTWHAVVVGRLSLHGVSKSLPVTVRLTYMPESEKTKQRLPGDLLAGRADFRVNLSDFGVKGFNGVVGSKVSETIYIKVSLVASATAPSAENPCNPCAKTAK